MGYLGVDVIEWLTWAISAFGGVEKDLVKRNRKQSLNE